MYIIWGMDPKDIYPTYSLIQARESALKDLGNGASEILVATVDPVILDDAAYLERLSSLLDGLRGIDTRASRQSFLFQAIAARAAVEKVSYTDPKTVSQEQ